MSERDKAQESESAAAPETETQTQTQRTRKSNIARAAEKIGTGHLLPFVARLRSVNGRAEQADRYAPGGGG